MRVHNASAALAAVATGTAIVLAAQVATTLPAAAGTEHSIITAPSPSTGEPITGGGSWIVNKPSGYYLGRAVVGSTFDDEVTSGGNWHFGRAVDNVDMCGWVMPGSMGATIGTVGDSCSSDTESAMSHRLSIGRDYNAPAHAATDGTEVPANTTCQVYFNYFHGSDFATGGGHWTDAAGTASATVAYRFTTLDGAAVVVRDPSLGWGFLPIGCVQRPAALYNDND